MTLTEFINEFEGQYLEWYDSTNKNQCFDLFTAYLDLVCGLGNIIPIGVLYAYEIYTKTNKLTPYCEKIPNTPDAVPQAGDIIIWSNKYGSAGHVAVATGWGSTSQFEAFSQNDPFASPCIKKRYYYNYILGWLRVKNLPPDENMNDQDKKDIESMNNLRTYNNVWYESKFIIADYEARKKEIEDNAKVCQSEKNDLNEAIKVTNKSILDLQNIVKEKNAEITKLKKDNLTIQTELTNDLAKANADCQEKYDKARGQWELDLAQEKENHKTDIIQLENTIKNLQSQKPTDIKRIGWHKKLVDLLDVLFISK